MPVMTIACERCDELRARFEHSGDLVVLGCDPDPSNPGLCRLRYERHAATLPPAGAAATLTPTQKRTAQAIVNLFETGAVLGDYGRVTVLPGDTGRLTYGRSQTSLTSGNLLQLLQRYCANPGAQLSTRLQPWLAPVQAQDERVDHDERLHNLLRACADDVVMRDTQDSFFDDTYWQPALKAARALGLGSALAVAVVYDSHVHGSWARIKAATRQAAGEPAAAGEQAWITAYVDTRRQWLATHANPLLRKTAYRMDAFRRLIDQGLWGLPLPLVVRDQEISLVSLSALPPGCHDGPQPGSRTLALSQPLQRGLDVRRLQLGLSERGMDIKADGVFGPTSRNRLAEYQIAHGLPATGVATPELVVQLAAQ